MKWFTYLFTFFVINIFLLNPAKAVTAKVVVTGMDRPWAVVSAPDGNIWITEKRKGHIRIYNQKFSLQKTLSGLPNFSPFVEGGLLDIAFHPNFNSNKWMYAAYTVKDSIGHHVRIARFTYRDNALKDMKILIKGPESNAQNHFGSRLLFDDRGYLLATFGERLDKDKAQDVQQMHGKIVRLTDDGGIPQDNPYGATSPVYSIGHRNPQGLAIHPVSRRLYDSEHGPSSFDAPGGGDEINEVRAGGNYGWPLYHHDSNGSGMIAPLVQYTPAVAPSGMHFYTGNAIPDWKNDLFVACLKGQEVLRLRIDNKGSITQSEFLFKGQYGRLRDTETAPDGSLLILAEDGRLIQVK